MGRNGKCPTSSDRRHHSYFTIILTKPLRKGYDSFDIVTFTQWAFFPLLFFCAAMKNNTCLFFYVKDFTGNETAMTNYCRQYIMSVLFSLCSQTTGGQTEQPLPDAAAADVEAAYV